MIANKAIGIFEQKGMKLRNFSNYEIYPQEGKIWSYKRNRFIGCKDKDGYLQCTLYADDGTIWTTTIHRLVWIAVNGDIPKGYEVNHIDEHKDNNSIANLNLMTRKENINFGTHNERMAKALKGNTNKKGKYNNKSSKQVGMYKDGVLILVFPSTQEAQRNGFNSGAISNCCNGLRQSHKGYKWQYI